MEISNGNQTGLPTSTTYSMDTFSYTALDFNRIIGNSTNDASFLHNPSNLDLKRMYETETKRALGLQLHVTTMTEYFRTHRIPRGMRIQPRTNSFTNDLEYRAKYEAISNKYALDLILLNLEFLQHDLLSCQTKIAELETTLKSAFEAEELNKLLKKEQNFLVKQQVAIEETKRKKWFRDNQDYINSRVYAWDNVTTSMKRFSRRNYTGQDVNEVINQPGQTGNNAREQPNKQQPFLGVQPFQADGRGEGADTSAPSKKTQQNTRNQGQATGTQRKK
ncbi:uncharacterized protein LOC130284150 [Hyla sarda]|uniref:uncharacterized protein LOC130284150 n=1 Tax=Hyla sarda TaxID=327740 RepID=UPI0024C3071F|nr:uncharacterized protein LOC130284150 [Hyla sarda]